MYEFRLKGEKHLNLLRQELALLEDDLYNPRFIGEKQSEKKRRISELKRILKEFEVLMMNYGQFGR